MCYLNFPYKLQPVGKNEKRKMPATKQTKKDQMRLKKKNTIQLFVVIATSNSCSVWPLNI